MTLLFRQVVFGWIEFQPKLRSLLGRLCGGRCLLLTDYRKEGDNSLIVVFCVGVKKKEETVNHILIHCIVVRVLWDIVLGLLGVQWVFPKTVKDVLTCWRGLFVGKKRKKIWKSIPLCIFWTIWKERDRLAFRGGGC